MMQPMGRNWHIINFVERRPDSDWLITVWLAAKVRVQQASRQTRTLRLG